MAVRVTSPSMSLGIFKILSPSTSYSLSFFTIKKGRKKQYKICVVRFKRFASHALSQNRRNLLTFSFIFFKLYKNGSVQESTKTNKISATFFIFYCYKTQGVFCASNFGPDMVVQ